MSKFLMVNLVLLALFFIFVATNNFMRFTPLGYVVLGLLYLVVNTVIYFCLRFLKAIEAKKMA